jgi:Domain of unknown function (DUF5753)
MTDDSAEDLIITIHARDQVGQGRVGMGPDAIRAIARLNESTRVLRWWSPNLIPGPLQTANYAEAAIRGRTPSLSAEDTAARALLRVETSEGLLERLRTRDMSARFIVGESAVLRTMHSDPVHEQQLRRLLTLIDDPSLHLEVQVLSDDAPAADVEPYSLHAMTDGSRVALFESLVGGWYTVRPEDLARVHDVYATMRWQAHDRPTSRAIIEEALQACARIMERSSGSPATQTPKTASVSLVREAPPSQ